MSAATNSLTNGFDPTKFLLFPAVFGVGTTLLSGVGLLGGYTLRLIFPAVIPAAHAVTAGLILPASLAMYMLASRVSPTTPKINLIFAVIAGYFSAVGLANLLGYSVTFAGPFAGLAILVSPIAVSVLLIAPIAIALIIISKQGKSLRDLVLKDA